MSLNGLGQNGLSLNDPNQGGPTMAGQGGSRMRWSGVRLPWARLPGWGRNALSLDDLTRGSPQCGGLVVSPGPNPRREREIRGAPARGGRRVGACRVAIAGLRASSRQAWVRKPGQRRVWRRRFGLRQACLRRVCRRLAWPDRFGWRVVCWGLRVRRLGLIRTAWLRKTLRRKALQRRVWRRRFCLRMGGPRPLSLRQNAWAGEWGGRPFARRDERMGVCWGGNPQRRNGWPRTREQAGIHHSLGAPDELDRCSDWGLGRRISWGGNLWVRRLDVLQKTWFQMAWPGANRLCGE